MPELVDDAVKELSPAELEVWRGLLRVHAKVLKELNSELEAAHGLSLSSYEVLLVLHRSEREALRMSDIADAVLLTPGGGTRLVDRLCERGLVDRQPDERDLRVLRVRLTEEGRRAFNAARATHLEGVRRRFLEPLDPSQLESLAGVWRRLLDGDRAADDAC